MHVDRLSGGQREARRELNVGQRAECGDGGGQQECQGRLVSGSGGYLADEYIDTGSQDVADTIQQQQGQIEAPFEGGFRRILRHVGSVER